MNSIRDNDVTLAIGPAGSGKTFIACAQALKLLKTDTRFKKILLVKSVTVLEGEEVGFLKGDLKEKMFPFTISFLDNFHKIIGEGLTQIMLDQGYIEVLPLAYIRGRSIDNAIIIVDEAQNITQKNMRSTMTRIGTDTKMIITGDTKQVDMKNSKLSSLDLVVRLFENKEDIGTMSFSVGDIVRDPIVKIIEETFDEWEEKNSK
jgi:phosphate starvation-inducible PhoH-like protein